MSSGLIAAAALAADSPRTYLRAYGMVKTPAMFVLRARVRRGGQTWGEKKADA